MSLRISVVTPCFQAGEFLEGCIHSIANQEYSNVEHIIVDGGSTDNTKTIVERNRESISSFVSEPDEGMYDAINKGFSRASGDIYCWLNSDDRYFPGAFSVVAEIFEQFPDILWITGFPAVSSRGIVTSVGEAIFPRDWIEMGFFNGKILPHITQETVFWRRECWERVGPIPQNLKLAGDFWLWRKFAEKWDLVFAKALLASFSMRPGQLSDAERQAYEKEVSEIISREVIGDCRRRRKRLYRVCRLWWLLRWIPRARGLVLRSIGKDSSSYPVLSFSMENGWSREKKYIGTKQAPADRFLTRLGRWGSS